jgi:tRNA threonylcarbamoyladenosine biosynthesis protein TsaE
MGQTGCTRRQHECLYPLNGELSMRAFSLHLPNLTATQAFGRSLGQRLWPGAVVALVGELGAGKTHLVRAIAEGLDIPDSRVVTSPTFVLVQEYAARLPIYHVDAYRLRTEGEFADLGVHEYFESGGVCLIEWADRVLNCLPDDYLTLALHLSGETSRHVEIAAKGKAYETWMEQALLSLTCEETAWKFLL